MDITFNCDKRGQPIAIDDAGVGLAVTLDLVPDLFSAAEQTEIAGALRANGLEPCRRFIRKTDFCHNWNCVLLADIAGWSIRGNTIEESVSGQSFAIRNNRLLAT